MAGGIRWVFRWDFAYSHFIIHCSRQITPNVVGFKRLGESVGVSLYVQAEGRIVELSRYP
jgi:hypothetical protein